ncbi:MAG: tryptophan synthase subunit alpha [Candidatus Krumholzibacteria bacterium]|jgi:tryptophan synthase alpha chain|nr:tryptophan synthase subunit alpha [Candidatus Krumholzibacteria bacterium]MDP6668549.1 tryptophan synthase subunit alpha [Candidatus Krumholzibacteria bacterium]MDP6797123.1 tryptophan synthase subunit alpha [Candidatus Krumholzibacteria bacterium]MDP7021801.1 tryptophan synthase subunit alpha [Candidatus Krumholzibacteria bacterium]
MDPYAATFRELSRKNEGAFVPFTVLGDPDPESSLEVLRAFAEGGADMLELGIPFSDPVADGPVIQAADLRALETGCTPVSALNIVKEFRRDYPAIPVGLLIYANLAHERGLRRFYRDAASAGVDSILVADVPLEESSPFAWAAELSGIADIRMVTPLSGDARIARICRAGGPFLYVVSRRGVTGRDSALSSSAGPLLRKLKKSGGPPSLLGFGIGKPSQVREALAAGADGAISGSAMVEIIARHARGRPLRKSERRAMAEELREFTAQMKRATKKR